MGLLLPHPVFTPTRPVPRRTAKEHLDYGVAVLARGAKALGGTIGILSTLVGGSVLAYSVIAAGLGLPWIVAIAAAALVVVIASGSYSLWSEAYDQAFKYTPTWQQIQTRADVLRALIDQSQGNFRAAYMSGHMVATRHDYDRAVAAGYPVAFDRERIAVSDVEDARELVAALDDVVEQWRAKEERTG